MSTLAKRLIPLLDRIVISKVKPAEKTASGILIPEKAQESLQQGVVVAVGPGDKEYKMNLKEGDKVVLPAFGGTPVKVSNEETLYIYRENEIPAKIEL